MIVLTAVSLGGGPAAISGTSVFPAEAAVVTSPSVWRCGLASAEAAAVTSPSVWRCGLALQARTRVANGESLLHQKDIRPGFRGRVIPRPALDLPCSTPMIFLGPGARPGSRPISGESSVADDM